MSRRRLGLFALAFASGFAVLTIEIAGARLIAPVFGLSAIPWTAVIGVILTALAVGNHLGGRLADAGRVPLSRILVVAGLTGALPVLGAGVPWVARSAFGFIPGAVVSALVLFAPSVLCLGAVVPYLVRADTESLDRIGRRAGDISAVATAGSILGSFTTGFLLLPAMPVPLLLGVTAAALFVMAFAAGRLLGGAAVPSGAALAVLALPALGVLGSGTPRDTLHTEQTLYTSVAVTEREWSDGRVVRELWQNGGSSSAEYVESGEPAHVYATESLEILEPLIADMDRALVLGGAALTLPVAFQELRGRASAASADGGGDDGAEEGVTATGEASRRTSGGPLTVDVVEIDPAVTRLAEEYFAYGRRPRPYIRVIHEDARVFLRETGGTRDRDAGETHDGEEGRAHDPGRDRTYDLVYLDVFDHLVTVPWTMVTREALADMAGRLAPGGIFMANVLSPLDGEGTAFLRHFHATLESVFQEVHLVVADPALSAGATQNVIVVAARKPGVLSDLGRVEAAVAADARPFTDTWAPVEYLQAKVFLGGLRWR